jgi:DnaK suppressor protein
MSEHHGIGMTGHADHCHECMLPDLRHRLLSDRRELLASVRLRRRDLHAQSVDSPPEVLGEVGERRTLTPETEVAYELMGSHAHRLRQIEHALEKMDHGSYGHCEDCEELIAPPRLRALPFAVRCTTCQDLLERGGAASSRWPARGYGISAAGPRTRGRPS